MVIWFGLNIFIQEIRGVFKYECKQLHNFLLIYATTKSGTFLGRTVSRLQYGTRHKETHILHSSKTANYKKVVLIYTKFVLKGIAKHVYVHVQI